MRHLAVLLLFASTTFWAQAAGKVEKSATSERLIPPSWADLKISADPGDKKLVAEIEKMEWWDACAAWGRELRKAGTNNRRRAGLGHYLSNRQLINSRDSVNAQARTIQVGMTQCGVFASLGSPEAINWSTNAYKKRAQMVYRSRNMYVYTEGAPDNANGLVTSFSE
jgi:hypothetical protein